VRALRMFESMLPRARIEVVARRLEIGRIGGAALVDVCRVRSWGQVTQVELDPDAVSVALRERRSADVAPAAVDEFGHSLGATLRPARAGSQTENERYDELSHASLSQAVAGRYGARTILARRSARRRSTTRP
jgi:hypothetical protein